VAPVPKWLRRKAADVYREATHGPTLAFGAAGRSPLRDRALTEPGQPTAIRVDPAPLIVADKSTLAVAGGGGTYSSVWRAGQARVAMTNVDVASVHVVEFAELAA
jgi:hypothetical protein